MAATDNGIAERRDARCNPIEACDIQDCLARQELAIRLDHPELREGTCQVAEDGVRPRLAAILACRHRPTVSLDLPTRRTIARARLRCVGTSPLDSDRAAD